MNSQECCELQGDPHRSCVCSPPRHIRKPENNPPKRKNCCPGTWSKAESTTDRPLRPSWSGGRGETDADTQEGDSQSVGWGLKRRRPHKPSAAHLTEDTDSPAGWGTVSNTQ